MVSKKTIEKMNAESRAFYQKLAAEQEERKRQKEQGIILMSEYKHGGINWGQALVAEPVPYIEAIARSFDCINTGLFLSFFTEFCGVGEWMELSDNIVLNHTGLSTKRWHNVRRKLMKQGVLKNKRFVQPTRSMFTLDDEAFERVIRANHRPNSVSLFAPPLSINRLQLLTFVQINLSVRDAIFLAAVQERVGFVEFYDRENQWTDWVSISEKQMEDMTYLNSYAQRESINHLIEIGVIDVNRQKFDRYFRYSIPQLSILTEISSSVFKGVSK